MILTTEHLEAAKRGETLRLHTEDVDLVVLRADLYDRVKRIVEYDDSEMPPEEAYPSLLEAWDAAGSPHDAEDYKV